MAAAGSMPTAHVQASSCTWAFRGPELSPPRFAPKLASLLGAQRLSEKAHGPGSGLELAASGVGLSAPAGKQGPFRRGGLSAQPNLDSGEIKSLKGKGRM